MFPPLCLPAAGEFFTEEESKRVEESRDYEIKFAVFEALQGLFGTANSSENESKEEASTENDGKSNDFAQMALFGAMNCVM